MHNLIAVYILIVSFIELFTIIDSIREGTTERSRRHHGSHHGENGKVMAVMQNFRQEALVEHNRLRALHGSPPLKLDNKLCPFTEKWAKKIAGDSEKKNAITETRSHKNNLGENIATCKCERWNGTAVTRAWYDEISAHNWTNNTFNEKTRHFTQLIWAASKTMCITYRMSVNKEFVAVVAHYKPSGNEIYHKSFAKNVHRLKRVPYNKE